MNLPFASAVVGSLVFLCASVNATADLAPEQVLVIANVRSDDSVALAKRYATLRHIPSQNILGLSCPTTESISRAQYDRLIALPIRTFIQQKNLAGRIKVLTTVYGVPLKVGAAGASRRERQLAKSLRKDYLREFRALEDLLSEFDQLAGISTTQPTTLPVREDPEQFARRRHAILTPFLNAMNRIHEKIKRCPPDQRRGLTEQLIELRIKLEGHVPLAVQIMQSMTDEHPEVSEQLQEWRRMNADFTRQCVKAPTDRDVKAFYHTARQLGGQLLVLQMIYEDFMRLTQANSSAAVDSELTLVMHPRYMLAGKVPNTLNPRLAKHPFAAELIPVFMTARLDGPTREIVERMMDDALRTERIGLAGKAYIDARGLRGDTGYARYDRDLIKLAETLKEKSKLTTILDRRSRLFAPQSCPEAAIYCGWYSLRNYVPAFDFVPGAVAVHIASFEAVSLHNRALSLWCPKLLEAGAAATIGAVDEPVLDAFPLPSEFFPLLLCGKYSLVEAFFMTNRYNSWRMILIGDPLYKPFAKNPQWPEPHLPDSVPPLNLIH